MRRCVEPARRRLAAFDRQIVLGVDLAGVERHGGDHADPLDAGHRLERGDHLRDPLAARLGRLVVVPQEHLQLDETGRREAELVAAQRGEAAAEQACAGQQHQGQPDLDTDKHAAQAAMRRDRLAGAQQRGQAGARRAQRRGHADEERAGQGHAAGEAERAPVEGDGGAARQVLRTEGDERVDAPGGQQHAERAAHGRVDGALGEQLQRHAAGRGADSGAQGQLALAPDRVGQEQAGHVTATDEEQQADRAEQGQQRGPHRAGHVLAQRLDATPPVGAPATCAWTSPATRSMSAWAAAGVTPARSRATTWV